VLIMFSGLPGTGKTTLARALAHELGAVYLRIDTIEEALLPSGGDLPVGDEGYRVAYAVAEDNLALGRTVVADSVNPLRITREAWRAVAERAGVASVDILVECTDRAEHRRRVETRKTGLRNVTWHDVITHQFDARDQGALVIDTAGRSVEKNLAALQLALAQHGPS
jgi:predicted kinase